MKTRPDVAAKRPEYPAGGCRPVPSRSKRTGRPDHSIAGAGCPPASTKPRRATQPTAAPPVDRAPRLPLRAAGSRPRLPYRCLPQVNTSRVPAIHANPGDHLAVPWHRSADSTHTNPRSARTGAGSRGGCRRQRPAARGSGAARSEEAGMSTAAIPLLGLAALDSLRATLAHRLRPWPSTASPGPRDTCLLTVSSGCEGPRCESAVSHRGPVREHAPEALAGHRQD